MKTPRYSWEKEMMLDGGWCKNFQCFCSISCIKSVARCCRASVDMVRYAFCVLYFAFCVFHFVFCCLVFLTGKDCLRISDDEPQVDAGGQGLIFVTFNIRFAVFWSLTTVHHMYVVSYFGYQFHVAIARFSEKNLQIMGMHHQYLWQNVTSMEQKFLFDVWKKTCPCPLPPY